MTIVKAAQALLDADKPTAMRPRHWRGEGTALVAHGGQLYRHTHGQQSPGVAYVLTLNDLISGWEVVPLDRIEAEANGTAEAQPKTARRRQRSTGQPTGKRGRPPAETVAADHPGWNGVAEVARALGVSTDRIRRAIRAGLLASKTVRGVVLVRGVDCLQLTKPTLVPPPEPSIDHDVRPTPDIEPEVW